MKVKKILFIGLSSVGDVVMTTPILQSLHGRYPEAVFDIVADHRSMELYKNFPYLNELFIKNKNLYFRGVPALLIQLWRNRYDVVVDVRSDGLAYLLRTKKRYTKWTAKKYGPHAVEELMGVIAELHGNEPIPDTKLWLTDSVRVYAKKQLSVFDSKDKILALSIGDPGRNFKSWTEEKYIELIQKYKDYFSGLVFLGGQSEIEPTKEIIPKLDIKSIDTTGNSLYEAAALLEKCLVYIGPDSGLGHIASAVKTPTITFFGYCGPERFRPWGNKAICLQGEYKDASNISTEEVANAIDRLIK